MSLSREEKMAILLEQLQIPSQIRDTYFESAAIRKLTVYKKRKLWHFHIGLKHVLVFEIYRLFFARLKESFQETAAIHLTLLPERQELNEEDIVHYWRHFLESFEGLLPNHAEILKQIPKIDRTTILFDVKTEAEAAALKRKMEAPFKQYCLDAGLMNYIVDFQVKTEQEEIDAFRKQTNEEDRQLALHAVKLQKEMAEKNGKAPEPARLKIGYDIHDETISMENILEEERRVAVQGYVFASDVRKLRSGRSLLILKATDYTDSLEIKMFSRNDEDEAVLQQAKEGIWIKARGRIQTDLYSNELTMMANDIQEVSVELRTDRAEEKRVELHAHTTMSQLDAVVSPTHLI